MPGTVVLRTRSAEETAGAAERLMRELKPGDVVGLIGELGAGKTSFVRGMAKGCGTACAVKSPSFTVLNVYAGGAVELYHMDLYRLNNPDDLHAAGLEEYIYGQGVSVIEWADKSNELMKDCTVVVSFTNLGNDEREIIIRWLV